MRKPKYFVSIAGAPLHGVKSVEDETGRDISQYDGVGSGKFNVPDSKDPKTWTIECELLQDTDELKKQSSWRASEIFKVLDSAISNSTSYSRLIVTNELYPEANFSAMVWVKKYSKKEEYAGVYVTTIIAEEYKPVGVKTTGIPYVARPGKIPPAPKTVVITKQKKIYSTKKKYGVGTKTDAKISAPKTGTSSSDILYSNPFLTRTDWKTGKKYLIDPRSGKPLINPAAAKANTAYNTYTPKTVNDITYNSGAAQALYGKKRSWSEVGDALGSAVTATKNAMSSAFQSWQNNRGDFDKKLGW